MATREFEFITRFLAEQQPAIAGLMQRGYNQVGGHYIGLTDAQQQAQARLDSRQLITDLLRGGPDREAIRRTVATAADPSIPDDIVNLAAVMERLFTAFVREQLVGEPTVAQVLVERAELVFARFRLGMSSALIEQRASAASMPHPAHPILNPTSIFTAQR